MSNKLRIFIKIVLTILSFFILLKIIELPLKDFLSAPIDAFEALADNQRSADFFKDKSGFNIFFHRLLSTIIPSYDRSSSIVFFEAIGYWKGVLIIFIADLLAFNFNFFFARLVGRKVINRLFSKILVQKYDAFFNRHLGENFFLTTFLLILSIGNYFSYFLGTTSIRWTNYIYALLVSIFLTNFLSFIQKGLLESPIILGFLSLGIIRLFLIAIIISIFCLSIFKIVKNVRSQLKRQSQL